MNQTRKAITQSLRSLRERYPNFWVGTEAEWAKRLEAYFGELRRYDNQTIITACNRASRPQHYPDRFPTAGQLAIICQLVEAQKPTPPPQDHPEPHRPRLDPNNPFEQMARTWEAESQALGLDPREASPRDIGRRRMKELRQMWEKHAKIGDVNLSNKRHLARETSTETGEPDEDQR